MNNTNEAVASACNDLVLLMLSDKLHKDFSIRTTISDYAIYAYKTIDGNYVPEISTFVIPTKESDIERFNKEVAGFIARVQAEFSK